MKINLFEANQKIGGKLVGDPAFEIAGVNDPIPANSTDLCFIESESYIEDFAISKSLSWVISPKIFENLKDNHKNNRNFIVADRPYLAFASLVRHFHPEVKSTSVISDRAFVHSTAKVHPTAQIDAFAFVGEGAEIGAHVIIHPHAWIDKFVKIGDSSIIYSGAKIYHDSIIGARNVIHGGAVIGSDGFGFLPSETGLVKIPQVGRAVLHDDVEVGANTTIDRGTLDDTVIGKGTKIDNLVQIGHNCKVGMNCILCGFVGLSGNTVLGNNVLMAGQAGTKGHMKIGDNVQVGAQSGVSKDIPANMQIKGYPAIPLKEYLKVQVLVQKLPEIYKRIRALESQDGESQSSDD